MLWSEGRTQPDDRAVEIQRRSFSQNCEFPGKIGELDAERGDLSQYKSTASVLDMYNEAER